MLRVLEKDEHAELARLDVVSFPTEGPFLGAFVFSRIVASMVLVGWDCLEVVVHCSVWTEAFQCDTWSTRGIF